MVAVCSSSPVLLELDLVSSNMYGVLLLLFVFLFLFPFHKLTVCVLAATFADSESERSDVGGRGRGRGGDICKLRDFRVCNSIAL